MLKRRLSLIGLVFVLCLCTGGLSYSQDGGASLTLSWQPPTKNTDGTPISVDPIDHYNLYTTKTTGAYTTGEVTNVGNVSRYTKSGLLPNTTYYFVVTAINTSGNESAFSNEVSKATSKTDKVPGSCTLSIQ
jgi:chitodextrinase